MCSFAPGRDATRPVHRAFCINAVLCWIALFAASSVVLGKESIEQPGAQPKSAGPSAAISTGFVIIDGEYIAPPYVVEQVDGEVLVNGHVVALTQYDCSLSGDAVDVDTQVRHKPTKTRQRRKKAAANQRKTSRKAAHPAKNQQRNEIRREIKRGSLLIAFGNDCVRFFAMRQAIDILVPLLSDASSAEKRAMFEDERQYGQVTTLHWATIVAKFRSTAELKERIRRLASTVSDEEELSEGVTTNARWYGILSTTSMRYGITLTAMLLAVIATGNLLLYRPQHRGRWSDISDNADDALDVRRIVIILALLGVFDLLLTLAAQQTGAFLELNPLGSRLLVNPFLLATFKLTSMAVAAGILLRLRHYRGAQVASWWLCLLCTILTFRWVTFNSLFFA